MTCFRTENRHHSVLPLAVMFCLTFATGKIQAQHSMPIPACPSRGVVAPGATGLWSLDGCYGCPAESAEGGAAEEPFDHILPDFLHEYEGISAEYIYTSEVFTVAHGGTTSSNATRYRGNLDLVLTGDTEAMDLWEGGRFFVYGNSYHGQALTGNFVGDAQFYSNIDSTPRSPNEFLLMEYWYEHAFADGDIIVKVGKQDSNADFAYVDLGGDFMNSSFGFSPTIPLPTWPNPGLGLAAFLNLTDVLQYKVGFYDGSPSLGAFTGGRSGFDSLGENGAITLNELTFMPQLGTAGDLPGTYRAGAWYHTHSFDNLETGVGTVNGNHGFWTSADQMIWKEPGSDEEPQGLGMFLQYGWSPPDRNAVTSYFGTGLTYRGLISNRDYDLLGLGLASAGFSAAGTTREDAVELFYKAQINDWATIQPDVVYIASPSGTGSDALLVGIRTEVVF